MNIIDSCWPSEFAVKNHHKVIELCANCIIIAHNVVKYKDLCKLFPFLVNKNWRKLTNWEIFELNIM